MTHAQNCAGSPIGAVSLEFFSTVFKIGINCSVCFLSLGEMTIVSTADLSEFDGRPVLQSIYERYRARPSAITRPVRRVTMIKIKSGIQEMLM